jgi:hypothetical protein
MRNALKFSQVIFCLLMTFTSLNAAVLYGPVTNATSGHIYYLLTTNTWTASESEAESLGGTLAIVNNQEENAWLYSTFSMFGGVARGLWIGLTDQVLEGTFVWVTGEPLTYTNWAGGEPNKFSNKWGG